MLTQQEKNLQLFVDVLSKQQRALIQHDLPSIDEAVQGEVRLLQELQAIDNEIHKTIKVLAVEFGVNTKPLKLLDVTKAVKSKSSADYITLLQLQKSVRTILAKIQKMNSQNSLLIENARSFIKQTFASLAGVHNDPILDRKV